MKTIHLKNQAPSVKQLLSWASSEALLLVSQDGKTFMLEEADEFDQEVKELGGSAPFMRFLEERAKEGAGIPLERLASKLKAKKG